MADPREHQLAFAPVAPLNPVLFGPPPAGPNTSDWERNEKAARELDRLFGEGVDRLRGLFDDLFGGPLFNEADETKDKPEPIGENATPTRGGGVNTDLPGGEKAAEHVFNDLAEGNIKDDPETGGLKADNDVRLRRGEDGRMRVDVPEGVGSWPGHETIHFNP